jgi:hypothetical protein
MGGGKMSGDVSRCSLRSDGQPTTATTPFRRAPSPEKGVGTVNDNQGLTVNLDEEVVRPEIARGGPAMSAQTMWRRTAAARPRQRELGGGGDSEQVRRVTGGRR